MYTLGEGIRPRGASAPCPDGRAVDWERLSLTHPVDSAGAHALPHATLRCSPVVRVPWQWAKCPTARSRRHALKFPHVGAG
eukprot:scaffold79921_cov36-Tisochrysis_lutea.AAC.1